ncbi:Tyrosine-protein phosphatase pmp1 [Beauveria bassiana]|uniref:protein-tyrosine-phosphatase n=1 Tax=Beauveria bassiana TaxID=176275 RepID=A0A2N6NSG2_BEABA|nr:Tyrosine-protein phosphatase pmp1 [Beauveria bassiana]
MPSAAARRLYEDQIPTFMSVFDLDADTIGDCDTVTVLEPKLVGMDSKTVLPAPGQDGAIHQDPNHKHSDSTSTQMSESTDSSPTTTLSTTDSSPLTDRSPSSSPDSPVNTNLIPLNNYPNTTFGALTVTDSTGLLPPANPVVLSRPMTSPAPRRPRNMKGLSILPPLSVTSMAKSSNVEPATPCFIKPQIMAMKRKPSQLSLQTNTQDLVRPVLEVPPSPAMPPILQRRALKHSTSTPHMLSSIKTSLGPTLPPLPSSRMLERNESGLSEVLRPMKTGMRSSFDAAISEESSPIKPQMANRQDFEPYDESINNEDQKSPTYPDGPIAIYGDEVFLYLEPTAEEASKFDVVFNVAREVENPFEVLERKQAKEKETQPDLSPIPDTAVTTASFATAFEFLPDENSIETPTTPKANPLKTPEYIHIPWDHNTDIAPDLMQLCETIHGYTKQGNKVLIHCQQGASRSASLIIAYGLYLNPELSVNDAYYAAQAKSRWISPNMKLMYSLQDFQKELSKKKSAPSSAFRPRTGRSPNKHRLTLSADAIDVSPKEPLSAPLPSEEEKSREEMLKDGSKRARGNSSPGLQSISPGPASAPLTFSWKNIEPFAPMEDDDTNNMVLPVPPMPTITAPLSPIPPMPTEAPPPIPPQAPPQLGQVPQRPKSSMSRPEPSSNKNAASWLDGLQPPVPRPRSSVGMRALPLRSYQDQMPSVLDPRTLSTATQTLDVRTTPYNEPSVLSPRAETMTNPVHDYAGFAGMQFLDTAATPAPVNSGLFSPRGTTFPREASFFFGRPDPTADPRSPPTRGEAPIIRSIDDLL